MNSVEVEQESKLLAAELEVSEQLRSMNRRQLLYRFEFDDNRILGEQIDTIADIDFCRDIESAPA